MTAARALVTYTRRGDGGWITLNRPDRGNAITPEMVDELHHALDAADHDRHVRATVVTGAGAAFSTGADLAWFARMLDEPAGCDIVVDRLLRPLAAVLARLRRSERPTIAAVNGACYAGGLEILVACDLVLAARSATFCDAHARYGLAPAVGGVAGLVNAVTAPTALRMLMLAEVFDATAMAAAGLVAEVLPDADLPARVEHLTTLAATRSPASIAAAKSAVRRYEPHDWCSGIEADIDAFRRQWHGPELRDRIRAFVDRRAPDGGA